MYAVWETHKDGDEYWALGFEQVINTTNIPIFNHEEAAEEFADTRMGLYFVEKTEVKEVTLLETDLLTENARLKQWINDLQAGTFITCVYCGHNYGPDDEIPTSMANDLKEHVENCPEHPMSALKKELEKANAK